MQEDGAAGASSRICQIEVEHDDDVIEAVVAPQALVAAGIGQAYRAVVAAVGGVVAPAVVGAQRAERQAGRRPAHAVGAVEHGDQSPAAFRRDAIAFALAGPDAGPAEGAGDDKAAGAEQAAAAVSGDGSHDQPGQGRGHRPTVLSGPAVAAAGPKKSLSAKALPGNPIPDASLRGRAVGVYTVSDADSKGISVDCRHWRGRSSQYEGLIMPVRKILVVDDDDMLRESLVEQLSLYEEFEIIPAATAAKGVQTARHEPIDLVIMDVGLPDMDGREAVKLLRKSGFKAPVIMLTGQDSESDTILGLEAGANDYVVKPFRFAVLLARIRAQLRQHDQSEDAVFSIGRYTFRPSAKMLIDERNQKVRLTEKETAILKFLYRAGEKVITRDVLLHEVWGYNSGVTTHTLETHIYRLRQKIERDPSKAELLVTEAGGYKLVP